MLSLRHVPGVRLSFEQLLVPAKSSSPSDSFVRAILTAPSASRSLGRLCSQSCPARLAPLTRPRANDVGRRRAHSRACSSASGSGSEAGGATATDQIEEASEEDELRRSQQEEQEEEEEERPSAGGVQMSLADDGQVGGGDEVPQAGATEGGDSQVDALERGVHNALEEEFFDANVDFFRQEPPGDVQEKLAEIIRASGAGKGSRVLDVGSGTGPLVAHLLAAGVEELDIMAVDLSVMMLAEIKMRYDDVRCWHGDVVDLAASSAHGEYDVALFNAMFGNVHSQRDTLRAAVDLLKPGGTIVISHPLGRAFVERLRRESPQLVPHGLPREPELRVLAESVPGLQVASVRDDEEEGGLYLAILRVTDGKESGGAQAKSTLNTGEYAFWKAPLYMKGRVVTGFGRGSKQMGVPTANLPPEELVEELTGVDRGVYFGWAQLAPDGDKSESESKSKGASGVEKEQREREKEGEGEGEGGGRGGVHKMVMNVGKRPTFGPGNDVTVEVHILHKYDEDFYGKEVRVVVLGAIRREMKFASLDELVRRIHADIKIAETELARDEELAGFRRDPFFLPPAPATPRGGGDA